MAQTKKVEVKAAILAAAFELFRDNGYADTSIPAIAKAAGTSTANVYVYFNSKLDILFTLYGPWLQVRLDRLDRSLHRIRSPQKRLEKLLLGLWHDLPYEDNGFSSNLVQALASTSKNDYDPSLRKQFQDRVARWLTDMLPNLQQNADTLAGILLMAFDGFAINARLSHGMNFNPSMARVTSDLLAAPEPPTTNR